jgi:tRNA(fMet)-specific endonuclease VapC
MGLILDSSVVVAAERKGLSAAELLENLRATIGPETIAVSTISVMELEHGIRRAGDATQAERRRRFLGDVFAAVPAYPLTFAIARRAGRIDGESRQKGITIPFQDLVIGATALGFDYAVVATGNIRHFQLIPGLAVVQL